MSSINWSNPSTLLPSEGSTSHFTETQWRELLDEDNAALSGISILLTAIIGLGMLGMAIVVGILAFGG